MEGFVPMVFKIFKKSKIHREYSSLSAPATQFTESSVDFYPNGYKFQYGTPTQQDLRIDGFHAESKFSQGRNKSFNHVGYVAGGRYSPEDSVKSSKQLVRFRSQRRMFSCITGA